MSDKYIIKNCPCFVEGIAIKGNEQKTQTCNNHKVRELTYCVDITDCKLKQIVEKCKTIKAINKRNSYVGEYIEFTQKSPLAEEILDLLNIQEVE